jgi:hypothetical protein
VLICRLALGVAGETSNVQRARRLSICLLFFCHGAARRALGCRTRAHMELLVSIFWRGLELGRGVPSDSNGCHDRTPKRTRLLANTVLRAAGNKALKNERCQQLQSGTRTTGKRHMTYINDATGEGQSVSHTMPHMYLISLYSAGARAHAGPPVPQAAVHVHCGSLLPAWQLSYCGSGGPLRVDVGIANPFITCHSSLVRSWDT